MEGLKRDLTSSELKALQLVKIFEDAADQHKLAVTLHGTQLAAETIHKLETKLNVCKVLKVDYLQKTEKYAITFTISEFEKYMHCMLHSMGMELLIDGSVSTSDNLIIPNTYLDNNP